MSLIDIMKSRKQQMATMIEIYMIERNKEEKILDYIVAIVKVFAFIWLLFANWELAILLAIIAIPESSIRKFVRFMKNE